MAPNPHVAPLEWTIVKLGGWQVPAILIAINGIKIEDEWNVQRAIGTSGSSTVWRGTKPTEDLKLTFEAPTKDTFDSLYELYKRLAPKNGQRPPTVSIEHPGPNFVGINRVSRKMWEGPNVTPGLRWTVDLTLIQYFPTVVVPAGPQKPAKLPGDPTPVDDGEKVFKELAKKIAELSS
jgi:hypothetical protein